MDRLLRPRLADGHIRVRECAGPGRAVRVWDRATGKEVGQMTGGNVQRSEAGGIRLWDSLTGKQMQRYPQEHGARRLAFSPDGWTLIARSNVSKLHFWNLKTGAESRTLSLKGMPYGLLAVSPDGKYLAGGAIVVWDLATGRELFTLRDAGKKPVEPTRLTFSHDSRTLCASGSDHRPIGPSGYQGRCQFSTHVFRGNLDTVLISRVRN